jgi:hypothetical protein
MKPRLNELGHTEGRNLTFDCRYAEGEPEFLPQFAAEIVKNNPDVVVAGFGTLPPRRRSATAPRRESPKNTRSSDAAASAASPEGRAQSALAPALTTAAAMIAGPASDFLPAPGLIVAGAPSAAGVCANSGPCPDFRPVPPSRYSLPMRQLGAKKFDWQKLARKLVTAL